MTQVVTAFGTGDQKVRAAFHDDSRGSGTHAPDEMDHPFPSGFGHTRLFLCYCERHNEQLKLYFKDNGVGVAEDAVQRLFEPFYTTRRDIGKVGLNLHIAYNLVHGKLGGTIAYIRPEERGSLIEELSDQGGACFMVSIPLSTC